MNYNILESYHTRTCTCIYISSLLISPIANADNFGIYYNVVIEKNRCVEDMPTNKSMYWSYRRDLPESMV